MNINEKNGSNNGYSYSSNSSIVLVGMRGVGKSTLALLASAALGFEFLDLKRSLSEASGNSDSPLLQKESLVEFRKTEFNSVVETLTKNTTRCIIALPASCIDYEPTVNFLIEYGRQHLIVHIKCEETRILTYIDYDGPIEKGLLWVRQKYRNYQYCSHFDFFNLRSSSDSNSAISFPKYTSGVDVLALKGAKSDFLNFLALIMWGHVSTHNYLSPPEYSKHSSVVQINFPYILDNELNIDDLILGADAVEILVNIKKLVEYGIPLRTIDEFVARVRHVSSYSVPIIMTVDYDLIADQFETEDSQLKQLYFDVLLSGIRLGLSYLTIDLNLAQENKFMGRHEGTSVLQEIMRNSCHTKIIGAYHSCSTEDFWTTSQPFDIYMLAKNIGCQIIKITKKASRFSENLEVQEFARDCNKLGDRKTQLIAYNTGKLGRFSRIMNLYLTSTEPPYSINSSEVRQLHDRTVTSNENYEYETSVGLSAYDLNKSLYSCFMMSALSFYVVGRHVTQSLSPAMHNAGYLSIGLPHRCIVFQCSTVQEISDLMRRPDFGGASVIMPFKLKVLDLVDNVSKHVSRIGALNTIIAVRSYDDQDKISKIRGENTDWLGIRAVINSNSSPINGVSDSKTALVLGAGGMSQASLYALISLGFKRILLFNRTESKARQLADHFNKQSPLTFEEPFPRIVHFKIEIIKSLSDIPEEIRYDHLPTVIINCIPGRDIVTNKLIHFEIPDFWFDSPSGGVFVETGYNPLISPLQISARKFVSRGWVVTTGLNYLHEQAIAQFEMHTGKIAPSAIMKSALMNHFAAFN
ncbi:uncharacterized protein PRCAT00000017001 [Priceomyces carsonii]|uniref:uncharacterized protein n=1 Tax=Priceomyces carsonii TaxID=28549 RepID=UPI002EDA75B0|nr:unnamed protein product [Priceomyces carsonii]